MTELVENVAVGLCNPSGDVCMTRRMSRSVQGGRRAASNHVDSVSEEHQLATPQHLRLQVPVLLLVLQLLECKMVYMNELLGGLIVRIFEVQSEEHANLTDHLDTQLGDCYTPSQMQCWIRGGTEHTWSFGVELSLNDLQEFLDHMGIHNWRCCA